MDRERMRGRIHVYYGYGKGKTTSCMGLAVRALGAGNKVAIVQFDKGYDGENEHYSERVILRQLAGLDLHPTGCERLMPDGKFRFKNQPEDFEEAQKGLRMASEIIRQGGHDLVILDEILAATKYHLLKREEVMALLDEYEDGRRCELVLSGHEVWPELEARVDLITEMRKVKHYFDAGEAARRGIEF